MKRVHYINAGAGAGKTTNLVNRLSEILKDPDNKPAEIILTTFTKAAAKEFREKTFKRLLKDGSIEAAKSLDTATIGTVHSVAEKYIQRYWSLLGYSGQFNILTEEDTKKHINQSLNEFVTINDLAFFHQYALDFKLGKDDDSWKKTVVSIISKANAYDIDLENSSTFSRSSCDVVGRLFVHKFDLVTFQSLAKDYVDFLNKSSKDVTKKDGSPTKTAASSIEKLSEYNKFIKKTAPNKNDFTDLLNITYTTLSDSKDFEQYQRDSAEKSKQYIQKCLVLNPENGKKVKEYIERVFKIAEKWAPYYKGYKRQNNLLDFDDLEINFLKLLTLKDDDTVRNDIKTSIKYLFVDEFQDSNPIQLEIFQKLSDLVKQSYWVGDPKQAIYGFRGSDSSLTTKLLSCFPLPVKDKISDFEKNEDENSSQLLDHSYRSVNSLVELANAVFENAFANGAPSEIIDKENVHLESTRNDDLIEKPIQHWHCTNVKALATRVANILNGGVATFPGVYEEDDKHTWREEIYPSDIAILCRKDDDCKAVANALREKGITVASPETEIMENVEVKLILALLKYVKCQRYAKAELSKLWENKEFEEILKDIVAGRFNFDKEDDEDFDAKTADHDDGDSSVVASTPRDLFNILDERLQSLRGLNISSILKGLIATLDLYNVVTKWGRGATRRDNLNTLIRKAVDFERSTANNTNSASISSFIKYLKKENIDAKLDNGADGVKVATYHKSKGLQWKIVILYSLHNDELENTKFVKHEWCKLNLKTDDKTRKSELQLIPPFGTINEGIAEEIVNLTNQTPGMDDNGYYKMRYNKVVGEIKRLLYVGVTRARDYLVTISFQGSKDNPSTPLTWMKNVMGKASTQALDTIAGFTDKTFVDLWGVKGHESCYEKIEDDTAMTYVGGTTTFQKLKDTPIDKTTEAKSISPSSSKAQYDATPSLVEEFTSPYITHNSIKDSAAFGTCIHNYMAAHRWEGTNKIKDNEPANIALAKRTVENHNMQKVLPNPELMTQAADALFSHLESQFGPAKELLRECPFTYRRENGQVVSGEIDLIWKITDKDCVLVDHKNFPAGQDYGKRIVLQDKPDNKFYVGKYFPQLGDYHAALTAAGMNVTHVFVFYAVLGCLVEVKF